MNVQDIIKIFPDYPKEGINFYDINSVFASPHWPKYIQQMVDSVNAMPQRPTHLVAVESRGFMIAGALSCALSLPCVMVRKEGAKYPGLLYKQAYQLEYGEAVLTLQAEVLKADDRVLLVDDLIATGGSMRAAQLLIERSGAEVLGWLAVINLAYIHQGNVHPNILSLVDIDKD